MIEAKKSWWVVEDLGGGKLMVVPFYDSDSSLFRTEYFGETKEKALERYILNQEAYIKRLLNQVQDAERDRDAAKKLLDEVK